MVWYRTKAVIAAAGTIAAAGLTAAGLVAFTGGSAHHEAAPSPAASRSQAVLTSPFTGEPIKSLRRVLIVKIDNLAAARPQTGLTRADIIYLIPVEGGLSRIMAVFSTHFPPIVGPIRSSREDDIELLRQYGRPAFAYSGADPRLLPLVHQARIVDLYEGLARGYYRDPRRFAPHNLYARTSELLAQASAATSAHPIGFRFGPPPAGGRPTISRSVSYPAAAFQFRWSTPKQRWLVSMDGARAASTEDGQLSAATVVIQYTTVRNSRYHKQGVSSPYAVSVGSGSAVVLRDGKSWDARWSRSRGDIGTVYTTAAGQAMTFARGPVWIVLAAR